ncbi:hypothetical protein [Caldicellulosiruptor changbaiensis]|nr:hypothetical protein [Caldicellulosiruptor changbaiensis]
MQKEQRLALGLDEKKDDNNEGLLQRMREIVQAINEVSEDTVLN